MSATETVIRRLEQGDNIEHVLEEINLPELGSFLLRAIYRRNISVADLADLSKMNKTTIYRICDNKMNPSPNILIRLSRVLEMNIENTQKLLRSGNVATLSGQRARDVIIMDGIIKEKSFHEINDDLIARGMPDLFTNR